MAFKVFLGLQGIVLNKKQLLWLIARLAHLSVISLCNNTWAVVNALCLPPFTLLGNNSNVSVVLFTLPVRWHIKAKS